MAKKKLYNEGDLLLNLNFDNVVTNSKFEIKTNKLQISKSKKQVLSKNQQLFNKLIKKIETLEKQLVETKDLAFELTIAFSKEIVPVEKKLGKAYFEFAMVLDSYVQNIKLTKKQSIDFDEHIINLFNTALTYAEPDEQQEALFDKYSDLSYTIVRYKMK